MPRPAVVVHSLAHAKAALQAAAECGLAVTLLSAPGAAAFLGAGVFLEMIAEARRHYPGVAVTAVLDCGDSPGFALAALRLGIAAIRIQAAPAVRRRIAEIAAKTGAVLDETEAPALDLLDSADALAAARRWFREGA